MSSRVVGPAIAAAAVLLVTAFCLASGAARIGRMFPGFFLAENRTVLSVARSGWSLESASRAQFAQVVAVEGHPVARADEVQERIAGLAEGVPVTYRLRKGADVFTATVTVQRFTLGDFLGVYGVYALLGGFFALIGFSTLRREAARGRFGPAPLAFFLVCASAGLTFGAAGGVYGPYWLTPIYFTAQCLVVASVVHLAASFPQSLGVGTTARRLALGALYAACFALAAALRLTIADPSDFLPLVYVLYLLLANAIFVYAARLAIGLSLPASPEMRASIRRALAGIALVVALPVMIFLVYPTMSGTVSPLALVGPFAFFPLLTSSAIGRAPAATDQPGATSVRLRLSLLFLGAVETSFLIAVGVFWQNHSWAELLAQRTLNQRQQAQVERVLAREGVPSSSDLEALDQLAQTVPESDLVTGARTAARAGDTAVGRGQIERLAEIYRATGTWLAGREQRIGEFQAVVLGTLLTIAVLQAVLFMLAVRRWLIGPMDEIAHATAVIATGDLGHRIRLEASDELGALASSVNAMAASLQDINARVDAARAARQRATGEARDAERRRLARELHDGILQDLTAVRLRLESAFAADGALGGAVDGSVESIAGVIAAIRRVVDDLRPSGLGELTLEQAIAGHARILAFAHGVRLTLDLPAADSVPDWAMRDVYRIAQEASANALRHGAPSELTIRLARREDDEVVLEVQDDGAGFDVRGVAAGSGLHGMRERAAALGGDLEIASAVGAGATVRLTLRLPAAPSPPAPTPAVAR